MGQGFSQVLEDFEMKLAHSGANREPEEAGKHLRFIDPRCASLLPDCKPKLEHGHVFGDIVHAVLTFGLLRKAWVECGVDLVHETRSLLICRVKKVRTGCVKSAEIVVENSCDDEATWVEPIGILHDVTERAQVITLTNSDLVAVIDIAILNSIGKEEEVS